MSGQEVSVMLKRIAVVFTLVAALAAAAPAAPAAPAGVTPAAPGIGAEIGSDDLAWGAYFRHAGRAFRDDAWNVTSTLVCVLTPVAIGIGGVGGVVFALACGLSGVA